MGQQWNTKISPAIATDVDELAQVEFAAHQGSTLHRLMFPHLIEMESEDREEVIKWAAYALDEAIIREDETLYKACRADGLPIGLIGWTSTVPLSDMMGEECVQDSSIISTRRGEEVMERCNSWTPRSLDMRAWLDISKRLQIERRRVLEEYQDNGTCR